MGRHWIYVEVPWSVREFLEPSLLVLELILEFWYLFHEKIIYLQGRIFKNSEEHFIIELSTNNFYVLRELSASIVVKKLQKIDLINLLYAVHKHH